MHAIVRSYQYDPKDRSSARRAAADSQALHAAQPGYAGSLVIDDGKALTAVNLWESEQAAAANREAIGAQVRRLIAPFVASSSQIIAVGEVTTCDLGRTGLGELSGKSRRSS
jgi:hypothetical protein